MSHTFEELATRELDGLYNGALFLSAGDAEGAEDLLLDALSRSFHQFRSRNGADEIGRWLEGKLVATFVARHDGSETAAGLRPERIERPSVTAEVFDALDGRGLTLAAASVPWTARAALWLVLLRRWSYADAAQVMGIDREILKDLLRYRDTLMSAILGGGNGRTRGRKATGA